MTKTIQKNLLNEFKNELEGTKQVRIVSPFITDNIVRHLLNNFKGQKLQIITRYNLNDFRRGLSSIRAIERLLNAKGEIRSVKDLHSKLYLFDKKSVIITSANFTNGGFFNNKEFGLLSDESSIIIESTNYFNQLWNIDPKLLDINSVKKWKTEIGKSESILISKDDLPDYGASFENNTIQNKRYFIKFFGTVNHRVDLSYKVTEELEGGCSHFALSFSRNKNNSRPIRYKNGDIVFMARMTNTNDYAVFGRAEAVQHNKERDVASLEDIKQVPKLEKWPILVRVKSPIYINSSLIDCPKMNSLISELDYECFESTYKRFQDGEENINPKKTLMRKGDVILSKLGALWMEEKFNEAIRINGEIPNSFINKFYQGIEI